jgi:hypothetical protein
MTQQVNYQRVVTFLAVCIVLGAAFLVLKPDRDACVAAVGREVDAIIGSDHQSTPHHSNPHRHAAGCASRADSSTSRTWRLSVEKSWPAACLSCWPRAYPKPSRAAT